MKRYVFYARDEHRGVTIELWSVFSDHDPLPGEIEQMWILATQGNATFPRPTHISSVELAELPPADPAAEKASTLLVVGKDAARMVH